jgi:hypothetical protein
VILLFQAKPIFQAKPMLESLQAPKDSHKPAAGSA